MTRPALHLVCGKIAAGKSTLAKQLAEAPDTLLIVEDAWLHALFDDQPRTGTDYMRCSARLKGALGPHVAQLLKTGLSVVLDFAANTPQQRAALKAMAPEGSDVIVHVLDVPDAECLTRLQARNASGRHPFTVTDAMFHQISAYFALPEPDEGLILRQY